jgi:uncharacterized protein
MSDRQPFFIDTCVPMYAAGKTHIYQEPCRHIISAIGEGEFDVVTDVEVIQEVVYRFQAIGRREDGSELAHALLSLIEHVLPISRADMTCALTLQKNYPWLAPREAIHVATMIGAGLKNIISADRHFDQVREIQRVDPLSLTWLC